MEEATEEYVDISFTASSLDRIFNLLPIYEKAKGIAAALSPE